MRLSRLAFCPVVVIGLIVATGLSPWQRLFAQTPEQQRHPKFPELVGHLKAYHAARGAGNPVKAVEEGQIAERLAIEIAGPEDALSALMANYLGLAWESAKNYDNALTSYDKAAAIGLKTLGEKDIRVAVWLNNAAAILRIKGRFAEATQRSEHALRIASAVQGADHPDTAEYLLQVGYIWFQRGEYDKALAFQERALKNLKAAISPDQIKLATTCDQIGNTWQAKGAFEKASGFYELGLKLRVEKFGKNHASLESSYNHLAQIWQTRGDYNKAIEYAEEALRLNRQFQPKENIELLNIYQALGNAYLKKSEYAKATALYDQALRICEKILGLEGPHAIALYSSKASLFITQRDYATALKYMETALALARKLYGETHSEVGGMYGNTAVVLVSLKDYDRAIAYLEKAIQIDLKANGEDNWSLTTHYTNMATAFQKKGDYDKALVFAEKALKQSSRLLGDRHATTADAYSRLGQIWRLKKDFGKARSYFEKAIATHEKSASRHGYLSALGNFAALLAEAKEYDESSRAYAQLIARLLKFRSGLSGEKSGFTARYMHFFYKAIALELSRKRYAVAFGYDSLRRGLSIAEALSLKEALAKGGVNETGQRQMLDLVAAIESSRAEHAAALDRRHREKADELLQQIFAREKQKDELDQRLSDENPAYRAIRSPKPTSVKLLRDQLNENEIFVSYLWHAKTQLAFVIDKAQGIKVIRLGGSAPIPWEQSISNFHTLHTGSTEANILPISSKGGLVLWNTGAQQGKYDTDKDGNVMALVHGRPEEAGHETANFQPLQQIRIGKVAEPFTGAQISAEREKLRTLLFESFVAPVRKQFPAAKSWIISPDGPLYYLPFSLLAGKDQPMPEVALIHSAIVWQKLHTSKKEPATKPLLAFGNAVYGSGHSAARGTNPGKLRGTDILTQKKLGRMRANNAGDARELTWDNLNGTAQEIKNISNLAYGENEADKAANVYTGISANVDRILTLREEKKIGDYKYIHFAVHGLFVDGNPALNALVLTQPEQAKKHKPEEYASYTKNNPLKADGYLRAGDISSLNLNAELVVMSACETSLGHEIGGEGMVALPQSFLTAGARSVVASLWSVDDAATSAFMQQFYKYLLSDKLKPKLALANTQRDFREGKEFAQYRDPFFWAAFVIYGE